MSDVDFAETMEKLADLEDNFLFSFPIDQNDQVKMGLIELRPGIGGEEASLFAAEMRDMYVKGINLIDKHSRVEVQGEQNLTKIRFEGVNLFKLIRFEAGVHRVQRKSLTDDYDRIHTSTVTVAVLPEIQKECYLIDPKDLRFESFRSSGPGGQNANVSNSAVRVTHIPSGITVVNQEERNNSVNKEKAIKILQQKLEDSQQRSVLDSVSTLRKSQVKMAQRSEKIRTYNEPQNRVTDHDDQNIQYPFRRFIEGELLEASLRTKRWKIIMELLDNPRR